MDRCRGVAFVLQLFLVMATACYYSTRVVHCFIYNTLPAAAMTSYIAMAIAYLYLANRNEGDRRSLRNAYGLHDSM